MGAVLPVPPVPGEAIRKHRHHSSGSSVERASEAQAQLPSRRGTPTAPLLIVLLAVALWLRLLGPSGHGFDWGDGQFTHPDELYVGNVISSLNFGGLGDLFNSDSAWNPAVAVHLNDPPFNGHPVHGRDGFNYGSLPLYLVFIFQHLLQWLARFVPWWSQWKFTPPILAGRMLSAIFDTITIYITYMIGTRLAGRWTGLLAATLATFVPLSIQLAHFTTVDTILTTFATGCVLACIDLLTHGRWRDYALVGVWLAASLATKASGVALLLLVLYTVLWRLSRELRVDWLSAAIRPRYLWQRAVLEGLFTPIAIRRFALLVAAFMATLFLFQPYTFSDFTTLVSGIQYQSDLAGGKQLIFYTLKWHGTEPLSYPLTQLTYYSIGLPLALLAYAGVVYEWLRMLTPRRNAGFLVALFVVSYFVAAGLLYMKYQRRSSRRSACWRRCSPSHWCAIAPGSVPGSSVPWAGSRAARCWRSPSSTGWPTSISTASHSRVCSPPAGSAGTSRPDRSSRRMDRTRRSRWTAAVPSSPTTARPGIWRCTIPTRRRRSRRWPLCSHTHSTTSSPPAGRSRPSTTTPSPSPIPTASTSCYSRRSRGCRDRSATP